MAVFSHIYHAWQSRETDRVVTEFLLSLCSTDQPIIMFSSLIIDSGFPRTQYSPEVYFCTTNVLYYIYNVDQNNVVNKLWQNYTVML